jgi:uncharacterized protein
MRMLSRSSPSRIGGRPSPSLRESPDGLLADDLAPGPGDVLLGELAGVPFYIDAEQFRRWGDPEFLLDVGPGAPEGFSLGLPDARFVTLSPVCQARAA